MTFYWLIILPNVHETSHYQLGQILGQISGQLGQMLLALHFPSNSQTKHILPQLKRPTRGGEKSEVNKHLLLGSSYNQKGINP